MADTLPDEIISEILSPALKVPEHLFANLASKSPFAKYSVSSSAALLVCKAWLRVATPLLYNVVVLRSKGQARALHDALRTNRELGRFIKRLRVEGGFANTMQLILEYAPNITDLFLSLQIHSSDSSSGLVAGLPLINPARLIIYDDRKNLLKNKAVLQLIAALENCTANWSNLNTIVFPYCKLSGARESFVLKLCTVSTLKTVSFSAPRTIMVMPNDVMRHFVQIAQTPSLEAIVIRAKTKNSSDPPPTTTTTDPRLTALLRWADKPEKERQRVVRIYEVTARPPINPTFSPLSTVPQATADALWSRILFFAMLGLELRPKNPALKKSEQRKMCTNRLPFLLVSKLFYRLALPNLYRLPIIPSTALPSFADAVRATPSHGAHVRVLEIRKIPSFFMSSDSDSGAAHADIFHHTTRLRRLLGEGRNSLPWAALCALSESAGGKLAEISGMVFVRPADGTQSVAPLERLTALRVLTWDTVRASRNMFSPFADADFFDPAEAVPAGALPALEVLTIKSADAFVSFAQMELPNLRRVFVDVGKDDALIQLARFLRAHGGKIWALRVDAATVGDAESVLVLCPYLSTLACRIDSAEQYPRQDLGDENLPADFQHAYLTTLILSKYAGPHKTKEETSWGLFFSRFFKTAHLPALREVRVLACEWPTTEHAISKSVWVQAAERLSAQGIKLTDKTGAQWHPRLKAQRVKS